MTDTLSIKFECPKRYYRTVLVCGTVGATRQLAHTLFCGVAPLGTITTHSRHALVGCWLQGGRINDISFRMLTNRELAAAQGFPPDFRFAGTQTDITRQIGNSVCPAVSRAITLALVSV